MANVTEQLKELEKRITKLERLIDTFNRKQIFRKEVQFMGKVTNKSGTTVIN